MKRRMTHAARAELTNAIRDRYAAAARKDKRRRILDEFIAATGYHEKSAIRVLNTPPAPKRRQLVNGPRSMTTPGTYFLIELQMSIALQRRQQDGQ